MLIGTPALAGLRRGQIAVALAGLAVVVGAAPMAAQANDFPAGSLALGRPMPRSGCRTPTTAGLRKIWAPSPGKHGGTGRHGSRRLGAVARQMRLGDGRPLKSVELFHGARKVELGDLFALRTEIKSFSDIRAVLPSPRAAASAAH
jgi:hypothetical protein